MRDKTGRVLEPKPRTRPGVMVHPPGMQSPYLGHSALLHDAPAGAKILPPGLGTSCGERDREATARLKALEENAENAN